MQHDTPTDDYIVVGHIGALHGLRGWLKLHSHTDPPDNILSYPVWHVGTGGRPRRMQVTQNRRRGKALFVQLAHDDGAVIDDREAAAPLVGAEVAITRSALAPMGEGEYYWVDLIGLEVKTLQGHRLGTVDHVLETGANDVLVVRGECERLIPFLRQRTVRSVDFSGGVIVVDWDAQD